MRGSVSTSQQDHANRPTFPGSTELNVGIPGDATPRVAYIISQPVYSFVDTSPEDVKAMLFLSEDHDLQHSRFFLVTGQQPKTLSTTAVTSIDSELPWLCWIMGLDAFVLEPHEDVKGDRIRLELQASWNTALHQATAKNFEYGMESVFSSAFRSIVERYGNDAVTELGIVLEDASPNVEVAEEAVIQLGLIDHAATSGARLALLKRLLKSDILRVRDAAGLSIASIDDPSALAHVRDAVQRETSRRVKKNLCLVAEQLERTRLCRGS